MYDVKYQYADTLASIYSHAAVSVFRPSVTVILTPTQLGILRRKSVRVSPSDDVDHGRTPTSPLTARDCYDTFVRSDISPRTVYLLRHAVAYKESLARPTVSECVGCNHFVPRVCKLIATGNATPVNRE
jgi:hypothetical protein